MTVRSEISIDLQDAVTASLAGDDIAAVKMMQLFLQAESRRPSAGSNEAPASNYFRNHASIAVRLNFLRANCTSPEDHHILRACPIFGRVADELTDIQRRLIDQLFSSRWDEFETGKLGTPRRAGVFKNSTSFPPQRMREIRAVCAVGQYIHYHPAHVISDVYFHLPRSMAAAGMDVVAVPTDVVMPTQSNLADDPQGQRSQQAIAGLAATFDRVKPHVVVAEGNYHVDMAPGFGLKPSFWLEQKRKHGFKLVIYIGDADETRGAAILPWASCADLIVTFHGPAKPFFKFDSFVCVPCLPVDERALIHDAPKDIAMSFSGTNGRRRLLWLQALAASGFPVTASLHDRSQQAALPTDEYYQTLGRSKLAFSNGWIDDVASLTPGRSFEAILSKALLLEQSGAPTAEYLHPFIHYVPVGNTSQLTLFARFLLEREDWRARICDAAYDFFCENYHSRFHWAYVCQRVLSPSG